MTFTKKEILEILEEARMQFPHLLTAPEELDEFIAYVQYLLDWEESNDLLP